MVLYNQRFLVNRALEFHKNCPALDLEDIISAGNCGLIEAVKKFKPDLGNRFTTYAAYHIKNRIYEYAEKAHTTYTNEAMILDEPVSNSLEGSENLEDYLCTYEEDFDKNLQKQELYQALMELSQKERDVLCSHFGAFGYKEATLQEIGEKYNITKQRVKQIETQALEHCKRKLTRTGTKAKERTEI